MNVSDFVTLSDKTLTEVSGGVHRLVSYDTGGGMIVYEIPSGGNAFSWAIDLRTLFKKIKWR